MGSKSERPKGDSPPLELAQAVMGILGDEATPEPPPVEPRQRAPSATAEASGAPGDDQQHELEREPIVHPLQLEADRSPGVLDWSNQAEAEESADADSALAESLHQSYEESPAAPVVASEPSRSISILRTILPAAGAALGAYALTAWVFLPLVHPGEPAARDAPAQAPAAASALPAAASAAPAAEKAGPVQEIVPISEEHRVPPGMGLLEVRTDTGHQIYVSGDWVGPGPIRLITLPPGKHAVQTRQGGEEKDYPVTVQAGMLTRLATTR
jgi:hypothetical protein